MNDKNRIDDLLKKSEKQHKKLKLKPAKVNVSKDGKIIINPHNQSEKEWYENDEEYDFNI
ncbi:hypothetical protein [Paraliobacillus ryukyuensis]|uniref:hypothetical protein n=1 Tax=Paraliobacillus ryukyuensis TaxID=200904 RepID=UPI0009A8F144|nr:hypothetical protein [Paraliobacillus ryukyuensis]